MGGVKRRCSLGAVEMRSDACAASSVTLSGPVEKKLGGRQGGLVLGQKWSAKHVITARGTSS